MKPKLIIFDLWGTLVYSPTTDWRKFYFSLKDFGVKVKTQEDIKRFSSLFSKSMCFSESWIDFAKQILKEFIKDPREENIVALANFLREKIVLKLYDDVKEVLGLPFKKAILTDSSRLLVENSGLQNFAPVFTPRETGSLKPDQKVFLTVLKELKTEPEQTVMVGDDIKRDLIPAKNLGIKPVLIDRENKFQDYPGMRINSLKKLEKILEGLPA